jgi:hypothetical protein
VGDRREEAAVPERSIRRLKFDESRNRLEATAMKPTPPLPKRLPKRPKGMTLARYTFLIESWWDFCDVTGSLSREDAEAEMHDCWVFRHVGAAD